MHFDWHPSILHVTDASPSLSLSPCPIQYLSCAFYLSVCPFTCFESLHFPTAKNWVKGGKRERKSAVRTVASCVVFTLVRIFAFWLSHNCCTRHATLPFQWSFEWFMAQTDLTKRLQLHQSTALFHGSRVAGKNEGYSMQYNFNVPNVVN